VTEQGRRRGEVFSYVGFELTDAGELTCRYDADGEAFVERFVFDGETGQDAGDFTSPAANAAARLLFLLAGVSYYKTTAARVIRGPEDGLTELEHAFLRQFYVSGLAEFAYRTGLDLQDLRIDAGRRAATTVSASPRQGSPLVPFGGGIDSIVVAEQTRHASPDTALFVANTSDVPFQPIEDTVEITGLPVRRLRRRLDPKVLESRERGYFNGHVPVTGVLSAAAVLTAVAYGHDRVVMSNEHSASEPTALRANGVLVNHQWSKSLAFEEGFRSVLAEAVSDVDFFSALRPYSELWVSRVFAGLTAYHLAFRSCNRAFHVDAGRRLATWCGHCDKCCFIDLILSPYLSPAELGAIFRGNEPLENADLLEVFRSLLGQPGLDKPLECVGDEGECRTAVRLAAQRPDRAGNDVLSALLAHLSQMDVPVLDEEALLEVRGPHFIPEPTPR
jgi:UDP-N-acetyl-alpha-D-muramoyl-L-alanyl-L-glutamate epimerase